MRVLLAQLDGKLPSVALMRIAAHHRAQGDSVELRHGKAFEQGFWDRFDLVYGSAIFRQSIPLMERLKQVYPKAILGGTAIDPPRQGEPVPLSPVMSPTYTELESRGIGETARDYSLYPRERRSVGFTMRGCRLNCSFCRMQDREGPARSVATIADLWRGEPWPRELLLLDNDFFGQPEADWRARIRELRVGKFIYRHDKLRDFGCLPYPMPYEKRPELEGFLRWTLYGRDKRVSWPEFKAANYQPRNLGWHESQELFPDAIASLAGGVDA